MLFSFRCGPVRTWEREESMEAPALWAVRRCRAFGARYGGELGKEELIEDEHTRAWACVLHVEGAIWGGVL
jgi:hypothetical protein